MLSYTKQYLLPLCIFPTIANEVLEYLRIDIDALRELLFQYYLFGTGVNNDGGISLYEELYEGFSECEWIMHDMDSSDYDTSRSSSKYFSEVIEYICDCFKILVTNASRVIGFLFDPPENHEINNFVLEEINSYTLRLTVVIEIREQLLLTYIPPAEEVPF